MIKSEIVSRVRKITAKEERLRLDALVGKHLKTQQVHRDAVERVACCVLSVARNRSGSALGVKAPCGVGGRRFGNGLHERPLRSIVERAAAKKVFRALNRSDLAQQRLVKGTAVFDDICVVPTKFDGKGLHIGIHRKE